VTEILSLDAPAAERARRRPAEAWIARLKTLALGLVLPILLIGGWELAVRLGWAEGRLLPAPSRVLATLVGLTSGNELAGHIGATLARVGLGFLFGGLAGIALGALAGASSLARSLIDPSLQALRAIPSLA
jgi:sulfonate transport system permease protein